LLHFTGVSDPYEPPVLPDVHLRTDIEPIEGCLQSILDVLDSRGLLADATSTAADHPA
jgi:adenylylsulfate kinase